MTEGHAKSGRRSVLAALGLVPAALALPGMAWAVDNRVSISLEGGYRVIRSNGIPNHETGTFPNRRNPNRISAQSHEFRVPAMPKAAARPTALSHRNFGVALNGIPFDPFTAEFWNRDRRSGWRYEAMGGRVDLGLDSSNAHVQPNGAYHYHGLPNGLIRSWSPERHSGLIGFAADGFPIYALYGYATGQLGDPVRPMQPGWQLKRGTRPGGPGGAHDGTFVEDFEFAGGGDLDVNNGRVTRTPDFPDGTYAYFLTDAFPFIPRSFAGTPDPSFRHGPPGGQGGGMGGRPPPPGGRPPPPGGPRPPKPPFGFGNG